MNRILILFLFIIYSTSECYSGKKITKVLSLTCGEIYESWPPTYDNICYNVKNLKSCTAPLASYFYEVNIKTIPRDYNVMTCYKLSDFYDIIDYDNINYDDCVSNGIFDYVSPSLKNKEGSFYFYNRVLLNDLCQDTKLNTNENKYKITINVFSDGNCKNFQKKIYYNEPVDLPNLISNDIITNNKIILLSDFSNIYDTNPIDLNEDDIIYMNEESSYEESESSYEVNSSYEEFDSSNSSYKIIPSLTILLFLIFILIN